MVAALKAVPVPHLVRFWLSWDGFARVEWQGPYGLESTIGKLDNWEGGINPPTPVEEELRGLTESSPLCVDLVRDYDALWALHERSCTCCGRFIEDQNDLSRDGECALCFIRRMACDHEAIKAEPAAWLACEYVGEQPAFDERGTMLELRNCPCCRSTLCKEITPALSTTAIDEVFAAVRS
jgi:hypothetical protein